MRSNGLHKRLIKIMVVMLLLLSITTLSAWTAQAQPGSDPEVIDPMPQKGSNLVDPFEDQQTIRVIVQLQVPEQNQAADLMTPSIHTAQRDVLNATKSGQVNLIHQYDYIPFMAVEVDQVGLEALQKNPLVVGIEEDMLMKPMLLQSVPLINADDAWAEGITGAGQVVAILDTGVDKNHPALAGKVVSEACYSSNTTSTTSLCPGGVIASTAVDSGLPCTFADCDHGTHVAGIVAANGTYNGQPFKGVAPDANIVAIQVFSQTLSGSLGSWSSDQIKGLERVFELKNELNVVAVNLSLGGVIPSSSVCDNGTTNVAYKKSVDKLRSTGVVTIAASGNEFSSSGISSPACISSVVSVGATTKTDSIPSYSNSASFLDFLAPGGGTVANSKILSTIPDEQFWGMSGTSMAAPHVAGAWALLREQYPAYSNEVLLWGLKVSGTPILDSRNGFTKPRIDVIAAITFLENIEQVYLPLVNK